MTDDAKQAVRDQKELNARMAESAASRALADRKPKEVIDALLDLARQIRGGP